MSWLACGSSVMVELEFAHTPFLEGGKPENPEKKSSEQGANQPQTRPTYGTEPASNLGYNGGSTFTIVPALHPSSTKITLVNIFTVLLTVMTNSSSWDLELVRLLLDAGPLFPEPAENHREKVLACLYM